MIASQNFKIRNFSVLHYFSNRFSVGSKKNSLNEIEKNGKELHHKIRVMKEEDINAIAQLRKRYTFYDGVSSYASCLKNDPEAMLVATINEKIIGCGSLMNNNDFIANAGFLTIQEDYRKSGLATEMIMKHIPHVKNRNIIVPCEPHLLEFHSRFFPIQEKEYVTIDYECLDEVNTKSLSVQLSPNIEILPYRLELLPEILEYDQYVAGYRRDLLVKLFCQDKFGKTFVAIRGSQCVGYGTIMLNIQGGRKLGPLYAKEPPIAEALLRRLLDSFTLGKGFAVSVVSGNNPAVALIDRLGKMRKVINFRVFSKERYIRDFKDIYAIFDTELEPF